MPPFMFAATYGGVPLLMASLSGEGGRDVVVQSPSRGDVHTLQDRGRRLRSVRCELRFVDEPGKAAPHVRFQQFEQLASEALPHVFSSPIHGSYLAVVTDFQFGANADARELTASCTFLPKSEPRTVFPAGAGSAPTAGVEEVGATVAATDDALAAAGLTSSVTGPCLSTVTAWTQAETPSARAVYLEAASLAQRIDEEMDEFELATDLDRWELYRSYITLRYQVSRAAMAVTSEAERVFDLVVREPIPARLLCAQVYGAAAAEERARQVVELNRLRTPGRIPPGTTLKMPAVSQ
jgi:hypothetical protein